MSTTLVTVLAPRRNRHLPPIHLTAALCAVLGLVFLWPAATAWLEFDRQAVASGQWWRLLSAQLAHWNAEHLFWDAIVFAALGALCEATDRRRFVLCALSAAVAIAALVWFAQPQLTSYRGLSGIDSALFGLLAATLLREHWSRRNWCWVAVTAALAIGFLAKVGLELTTGRTFFVDTAAAGFVAIPLAHAAGALVGALAGLVRPAGSARAALSAPDDRSSMDPK